MAKEHVFRFKQFSVRQAQSAMRISTDAVVLGALAEGGNPRNILDIGTGTGVLALMLAQRHPASQITAIEPDRASFEEAQANFSESPWSDRLFIHREKLQTYQSQTNFDLIICNPPYFENHPLSHDAHKNKAMHLLELRFEDLVNGIERLSHADTSVWIILPKVQMTQLSKMMSFFSWYIQKEVLLAENQKKGNVRSICHFVKKPINSTIEQTLFIKDESNNYTTDYISLLKDYLIIF